MRRGLRTRQFPAQIFSHVELERACKRRFDCGAIHLAVALGGVAITGGEKPTLVEHWQVDGASLRKFLAIDIPAEFARLLSVLPTKTRRRRHGELPEERTHRYCQARWQDRYIALAVKLEIDETIVGKLLGQCPAIGAEEIVSPVL